MAPPYTDISKSTSNWTEKTRHVCYSLQLCAVDLTVCNWLKFHACMLLSWRSLTVLTVGRSKQLFWKPACQLPWWTPTGSWVSWRPSVIFTCRQIPWNPGEISLEMCKADCLRQKGCNAINWSQDLIHLPGVAHSKQCELRQCSETALVPGSFKQGGSRP